MGFELDMPGRVVVGGGCRDCVGAEAAGLGFSRVLVVCDEFGVESGWAGEMEESLGGAGVAAVVYSGVTGEPDTGMVELGLEVFRAEGCDGVVAVGGGSVIDAGKTVSVMATNAGDVRDLMGVDNVGRRGAGLIAVASTSGTGSEATKVVVIGDSAELVKMTGRSRYYLPDVAVLDYELTMSMGAELTAAVGVDALTHAVEAYVSRRANGFTDVMALSGAWRIFQWIKTAAAEPGNAEARREMLQGSFEAGVAFSNASVALVHSMSEPLGACFHVPHGLSNAMLLASVTEFSGSASPGRYAQLARLLGLAGAGASDDECAGWLAEGLVELNLELGVVSPAGFGIEKAAYEGAIEKMSVDAACAGSTANNPVVATVDEIAGIYRRVYSG